MRNTVVQFIVVIFVVLLAIIILSWNSRTKEKII